jgi:hypothetical protein
MDFPEKATTPPDSHAGGHTKRARKKFSWLTFGAAALATLAGLGTILSLLIFLGSVVFLVLPIFALSPPTPAWIRRAASIGELSAFAFRCSMLVSIAALLVGNVARRRHANSFPVVASLCIAALQLLVCLAPYLRPG